MAKWYGKLGDTRAGKSLSSAEPIAQCKPLYPYFTYYHDRTGNKEWSTHGDESKGDPGCAHGKESHTGGGERHNEKGHREIRNHNAVFNYTYGPIATVGNATNETSIFGEHNTLAGQTTDHNRIGKGGGYDPDNTGKPSNGSRTHSADSAYLGGMSGGDKGSIIGGVFGLGAREVTMKSAGSTTIQASLGAISVSSKCNFLGGSGEGSVFVGGQGLSLAGKQQLAVGTLGKMSLYSATNIIWAPGGVYINCTKGPTCAETFQQFGKTAPTAVPGVKLPDA